MGPTRTITAICCFLFCTACSNYYRVTDPTTDAVYYTKQITTIPRTGTIKLRDANSCKLVRLQNSEIREISKDNYRAKTSYLQNSQYQCSRYGRYSSYRYRSKKCRPLQLGEVEMTNSVSQAQNK